MSLLQKLFQLLMLTPLVFILACSPGSEKEPKPEEVTTISVKTDSKHLNDAEGIYLRMDVSKGIFQVLDVHKAGRISYQEVSPKTGALTKKEAVGYFYREKEGDETLTAVLHIDSPLVNSKNQEEFMVISTDSDGDMRLNFDGVSMNASVYPTGVDSEGNSIQDLSFENEYKKVTQAKLDESLAYFHRKFDRVMTVLTSQIWILNHLDFLNPDSGEGKGSFTRSDIQNLVSPFVFGPATPTTDLDSVEASVVVNELNEDHHSFFFRKLVFENDGFMTGEVKVDDIIDARFQIHGEKRIVIEMRGQGKSIAKTYSLDFPHPQQLNLSDFPKDQYELDEADAFMKFIPNFMVR